MATSATPHENQADLNDSLVNKPFEDIFIHNETDASTHSHFRDSGTPDSSAHKSTSEIDKNPIEHAGGIPI